MNRHYIEDVINKDDKMGIDLTDIGIEEGQKYEGLHYHEQGWCKKCSANRNCMQKAKTNLDADCLSAPKP